MKDKALFCTTLKDCETVHLKCSFSVGIRMCQTGYFQANYANDFKILFDGFCLHVKIF